MKAIQIMGQGAIKRYIYYMMVPKILFKLGYTVIYHYAVSTYTAGATV
jgi:hypothetical protein